MIFNILDLPSYLKAGIRDFKAKYSEILIGKYARDVGCGE